MLICVRDVQQESCRRVGVWELDSYHNAWAPNMDSCSIVAGDAGVMPEPEQKPEPELAETPKANFKGAAGPR